MSDSFRTPEGQPDRPRRRGGRSGSDRRQRTPPMQRGPRPPLRERFTWTGFPSPHDDVERFRAWRTENLRWTGFPAWSDEWTRIKTEKHRYVPAPLRWAAGILLVLIAAVVIFLLLFDWNLLRGPISRAATKQLNREVQITGDLDVHPWSFSPRAEVRGVSIANTDWAGKEKMVELPDTEVQIKLLPLIRGKVILPMLRIEQPAVRLARQADGAANWQFGDPNAPKKPTKLPAIQHLIINDGKIDYVDAQRDITFHGVVSSNEQATGKDRGAFLLTGEGRLNRAPFQARVTGGPLVNIDPDQPYPFQGYVQGGPTRLTASGAIAKPFNLGQFNARVRMTGQDLNDLYNITGLTLPNTPPYDISGDLVRDDMVWRFDKFRGRVGHSDLHGDLKVDTSGKKPMLTADVASRRLDFADLAAIFGGAPPAAKAIGPQQQAIAAQQKAAQRLLPDATLQTDRLRTMNARVQYRAETINAPNNIPVRAARLGVKLQDAVLDLDPIAFSLKQGQLSGTARIDARTDVPRNRVALKASGARIEDFLPVVQGTEPLTGGLNGSLTLEGSGASVHRFAANSDGKVRVVIPGGEMRQAFAELLGVNATKGLYLLLSKDPKTTEVRCAVADFDVVNGTATARRIVLDTGVVVMTGKGGVNLDDETMNLRLEGKSKKPRLVRLIAPIKVGGHLVAPKLGVELGPVLVQGGVAAALGAVVNPLAAIIPFVTLGGAKDVDCNALLAGS